MSKKILTFLFVSVFFINFAVNAESKEDDNVINIKGINKTLSFECENRNVIVTGGGHTITLNGVCNKLSVSGSNQKVTVHTVADITVSGSENKVYWRKAKGKRKRPGVRKSGYNNKVIWVRNKKK